ncbi:winged helix-turn-helix domain-containing protein [Alloacidobacterium sp.]|uniref:winged helix-turn-helix domain-containing protein n=1 Tax=Alloacidobacterium sp. TaxID=2951999 RepID=UPI002D3168BB|nr:winged helix-turn-helix domain-containing protein [Alloacidobacterium sp.]HYK35828.1 winged helix-turn-helix domain-containing protein [Alloacidobacterium sp.]
MVDSAQYNFGPFRLVPSEHLLLREETPVPLAPKAFELLLALVQRHGHLVNRDELMQEIWPDSFVEEINLTVNISLLRKVLGEQPDGRQYIATVPKKGYRFDAAVRQSSTTSDKADTSDTPGLPEQENLPPLPSQSAGNGSHSTVVQNRKSRSWVYAAVVVIVVITLLTELWGWRHRGSAGFAQGSQAGTRNTQAVALYAHARDLWKMRSVESVQQSLELFQEAIDADPKYADAYAGLADAYITAGSYGNSFLAPKVAMPKAEDAAKKALVLDEGLADAHTSLAYIKLTYDWDWAGAEAEFKRALALDPNDANAHHWYSHELMAQGRVMESHAQSEQALYLAPTDRVINEHMAWHHMMAREYDRSIPQALKAIEIGPAFVQAHRVLGLDYLYTGRLTEACAEFKKGVDLSHGDPVAQAYLARCYALSRLGGEARQILASLVNDAQERYISSAEIGAVYAALDDKPNCLAWLQKAVEERASALIYLNVDPVFDRMRADPRFQAIVKQVGLTPELDETNKK